MDKSYSSRFMRGELGSGMPGAGSSKTSRFSRYSGAHTTTGLDRVAAPAAHEMSYTARKYSSPTLSSASSAKAAARSSYGGSPYNRTSSSTSFVSASKPEQTAYGGRHSSDRDGESENKYSRYSSAARASTTSSLASNSSTNYNNYNSKNYNNNNNRSNGYSNTNGVMSRSEKTRALSPTSSEGRGGGQQLERERSPSVRAIYEGLARINQALEKHSPSTLPSTTSSSSTCSSTIPTPPPPPTLSSASDSARVEDFAYQAVWYFLCPAS
ncbi:putative uncharacterized protein DDB_G0277255 [Eriocheir sinensis]|uniref:putative uncharacterized protein DDB_G0277255 n=1 Tax=Eriocheir sinensis TaxID=95602 RepID=UPI0021C60483|nr:putative uncharacterized protein DDB_G0277255 [Eriocheir sinensis]